jgi:hypothetical protein
VAYGYQHFGENLTMMEAVDFSKISVTVRQNFMISLSKR